MLLYSVPLDVLGAEGDVDSPTAGSASPAAAFRLQDRQQPGRFEPLVARDAVLALDNNRITASAMLREPKSDREIVKADLVHDLDSGSRLSPISTCPASCSTKTSSPIRSPASRSAWSPMPTAW